MMSRCSPGGQAPLFAPRSSRWRTWFPVAFALVLATAVPAHAQMFESVSVTGFNQDVVAESPTLPAAGTTTTALDASDFVLYTQAYAAARSAAGGLPDSGQIASGTSTYQLAPYTANNALVVGGGQTGTLSLTTPRSMDTLRLLAFSTEQASAANVTVHLLGGGTQSASLTVLDWFDGANPVASNLGRVSRSTDVFGGTGGNPRIYALDVPLSGTAPVVSVEVTVTANGMGPNRVVVLGVAGQGLTPVPVPTLEWTWLAVLGAMAAMFGGLRLRSRAD